MSEVAERAEENEVRDGYKRVQLGPKEFEIPEHWRHTQFNEVIELNPGYDKPDSGTFDFVPMDAVSEDERRITYFTEREKEDCTTTWFKNGDTIYPKITPCTENGKIAFVEDVETELASGSTEFLVFHPREGETEPKFVYYLANMQQFRAVTISLMEGSTGRQRVPNDIFENNLQIPVPPLPEQRRIAAMLSTVDEEIRQTEEIIEATEELKRGLMQDLLTEGIDNDGFKRIHLGPREMEVPADWEKSKLDGVAETITRGKQPTYVEEGGVPVLNQSCIYWDGFHPEELKRLDSEVADEWKDKYFVKSGDVLVNSTGKGTLGRALEWTLESNEYALDSHITRVHTDESLLDPTFFRYYLESTHGQKMLYAFCVAGSTGQIELSKTDLQSMPVLLPPVEEQREIAEKFDEVGTKIREEKQKKEKLQELKRALMQDLLTGEVRTPSDLLD
ncbi:restriction endonuclease subunit S [Haladaptatus sp. F3-133]|uniref:Restriction endonuclease subunit S n=1 Tax=Halorutilus salinus TaxID=2487751 RepID=A0A9Q4C4F9_9EURY|nr:restriction endonuclease subunit S [Halorutilus salinus]MCX2819672.1 restriction endonuclease subunit S [Halorutilus salinus]